MRPVASSEWNQEEPVTPAGPGALDHAAGSQAEPSERELWDRWRGERDSRARAELIRRHEGYAKSIAARVFARRLNDEVPFDDYHQLARLGLLQAIERYDPDAGAQFRTFATRRIQGAVLNGLESQTERHQQVAARKRLASERAASFVPEHMALGDGDQLLAQLGDVAVSIAVSMILDGIGLGGDARDGLPHDAYAEAELRQIRARMWAGVERLPDRERRIIDLHYRRARSFDDIAAEERVTKGRISQLHKRAIERLREIVLGTEQCDVAY